MTLQLLPYTVQLTDSNFYLELYRPPAVTKLIGIVDFMPEEGYISVDTNLGEIIFNWDTDMYPRACFDNQITIKQTIMKAIAMNIMEIDGLQYSWENKGDFCYIHVIDLCKTSYKAELVLNQDKILNVQELSFDDIARKYQMLYYAERNKGAFSDE